MKTKPPVWPRLTRESINAARAVLESGRLNYWSGTEGREFEAAFAKWAGAKHALAVSSGTAALHLALEALGIGEGDEVVVTPYSFRASATCVANAGAVPVFADVGEEHMLTAESIAAVITKRTKAVIVVHLYGQVADLGPILALARRHGLHVIEDCAQCLGGEYRGRKAGTLGDVGCFSFCHTKHITSGGEGGMIVCRTKKTADAVRSLRDHGWRIGSSPKAFDRIGYNFRMTEVQSAIGRRELIAFAKTGYVRRRRLAERLLKGISKLPFVLGTMIDTPERRASPWLVPVVFDVKRLGVPLARFAERLQKEGVACHRILWPLMAEKPVAKRLVAATLGFWVHPTMAAEDIDRELAALESSVKR